MKKLTLLLLFFTLLIRANQEDLDQAIIKSDLAQVKELLKTTKLSKEDICAFCKMAQNIIQRRIIDEKVAYLLEGFLAYEIIDILGNLLHLSANKEYQLHLAKVPEDSKYAFKILYITGISIFGGFLFLSLPYMIFKLTHKWHDNAIRIQQIIESQKPQEIQA